MACYESNPQPRHTHKIDTTSYMRYMRRRASVIIMLLLLGLWASVYILAPQETKSIEIQFGILAATHDQNFALTHETNTISKCIYSDTGFIFGYVIREEDGKPFRLQTTTYTPEKPQVLTGALAYQEPSTAIKSPPRDINGYGTSSFHFDNGDPSGAYAIEFFVDGTFLRKIDFFVGESCDTVNHD